MTVIRYLSILAALFLNQAYAGGLHKILGRGIIDQETKERFRLACIGKPLPPLNESSCNEVQFLYTDETGDINILVGPVWTVKKQIEIKRRLRSYSESTLKSTEALLDNASYSWQWKPQSVKNDLFARLKRELRVDRKIMCHFIDQYDLQSLIGKKIFNNYYKIYSEVSKIDYFSRLHPDYPDFIYYEEDWNTYPPSPPTVVTKTVHQFAIYLGCESASKWKKKYE